MVASKKKAEVSGGWVQKHANVYGFVLFLAGFFLFFANSISNERYNLPVAEFFLFGLLILEFCRQREFILIGSSYLSLICSVALIIWCTGADYYHNANISHATRVAIRITVFYGIILFYVHLPNKRFAFAFCKGLTCGYIMLFIGGCIYIFGTKQSSEFYELKYYIPTPAIIMLMALILRRHLYRPFHWFLIFYLVLSVAAMPFIGSRGAFVSMVAGGIAYMIARVFRIPRIVLIFVALMLPLVPFFTGLFFYEPTNPLGLTEWLYKIDYATISNIERTLMLNMNIKAVLGSPLLGIGSDAIVPMVEPYYMMLTGAPKSAGQSPHNYYLEFAVPFGLPPMLLIMAILSQLYRIMFIAAHRLGISRGGAFGTMIAVSWIMLYQPVASITRIDVFILMTTIFYGLSTHLQLPQMRIRPVSRPGNPLAAPPLPASEAV